MSTHDLVWFKSSYSGSQGDSCVEVALPPKNAGQPASVHVRDSKVRQGPRLALAPMVWNSFLTFAAHA